jgi:hypothetical protein
MQEILDALKVYVVSMRMGEEYNPIVFSRVQLDDVLIDNRFIYDSSIADLDLLIEAGHFASGNYFALTDDGDIVYASEQIEGNLNVIYMGFSEIPFIKH